MKFNYTKGFKKFIGIFATLLCPLYAISMHTIDGMPFLEPNIPIKCQFFGCLLNESGVAFTFTLEA